MSYDSVEYLNNFKKTKEYPKIHNDIFKLHTLVKVDNVLDLGCCYGLLTYRLAEVYKNVIGIESNKKYAKYFIKKENIHYYNFKIDMGHIFSFNKILKDNNIQAVYCRRFIPLLYEQGGFELLHYFKECLYQNNVKFIIIEGRFEFPGSKHIFKNCDNECEYFIDKYELICRWRNSGVLKLKK